MARPTWANAARNKTVGYYVKNLLAYLISGTDPDGDAWNLAAGMQGVDPDGDSQDFIIERVTHGFPVITTDHMFIHEKIAYTLSGFLTVASGDTAAVSVAVPSDAYVHFKPASVAATGSAQVTLYEDAAFTGGSTGTPQNNYRLGTVETSEVTAKYNADATITGTKTEIDHLLVAGGTGPRSVGGDTAAAEEKVLEQSTTYVVGIENIAGSQITVGYNLFWYEESGA